MSTSEDRVITTADVVPVGEIAEVLRKKVVRQLDGDKTDPYVFAVWSALNHAAREYEFSEFEMRRYANADGSEEDVDRQIRDHLRWSASGKHYALAGVIRQLGDALGVDSIRQEKGEVSEGQA